MTRLKNARNAVDNGRRGRRASGPVRGAGALRAQMEQLAATALRHRRLQQELTEKMRARAALEQRIRELCAQTEAHEQRRRGDLEQRRAALCARAGRACRRAGRACAGSLAGGPGGAGPRKRGFVPVRGAGRGQGAAGHGAAHAEGRARLDLGARRAAWPRRAGPAAFPACAAWRSRAGRGALPCGVRRRFVRRPHAKKACWAAVRDRSGRKRRRMRRRAQGSGASWTSFFGHFGVSDESQWKPCLRKLEQALAAYTDTDARLREAALRTEGWRRPAPPAPPRRRPQPGRARRQAARFGYGDRRHAGRTAGAPGAPAGGGRAAEPDQRAGRAGSGAAAAAGGVQPRAGGAGKRARRDDPPVCPGPQ